MRVDDLSLTFYCKFDYHPPVFNSLIIVKSIALNLSILIFKKIFHHISKEFIDRLKIKINKVLNLLSSRVGFYPFKTSSI